jgi:hypothetical protein
MTECQMAECQTLRNVEILQHCTPVKIELTTPNLTRDKNSGLSSPNVGTRALGGTLI